MTKRQIEKFAVGYPYPSEYVEILLKKYNFDKAKAHEILCKTKDEIWLEVQTARAEECIKNFITFVDKHSKPIDKRLEKTYSIEDLQIYVPHFVKQEIGKYYEKGIAMTDNID